MPAPRHPQPTADAALPKGFAKSEVRLVPRGDARVLVSRLLAQRGLILLLSALALLTLVVAPLVLMAVFSFRPNLDGPLLGPFEPTLKHYQSLVAAGVYLQLLLTQEIGTVDSNTTGTLSRGALIYTKSKYSYGTYEWRMRMSSTSASPNGSGNSVSGSVSAGFVYVNNSQTEIDFEFSGLDPETLYMVNWLNPDPTADPDLSERTYDFLYPFTVSTAFHAYKFVWQPGRIDFYVDGVLVDAVNDTTFTSGNVGLFLDVFDPPDGKTHQPVNIEVRFDNLSVKALPKTPPTPRPATPTATGAPQASPTGKPLVRASSTPSAGENWIVDTFDSNKFGWTTGLDEGPYATLDRTIADGKFRWSVTTSKGFVAPKNPDSQPMGDFVVAVEMKQTSGNSGRAGLTFRMDHDTNYYYFALSSSDKKYAIFLYYQGKWQTLADYTQSDAIYTDRPTITYVPMTGESLPVSTRASPLRRIR